MAVIDPSLRLTEAEIETMMGTVSRLAIATMGPGEDINLTPMTFGWAAGKAYIFGRGQKIANLRRDARATILVDTGSAWRELRGIMMRGSAAVLEDADAEQGDPHLQSACENLGEKHGLKGQDGKPAAYQATAAGRSRRWIVFTPHKIVSWDNSKLPA